MFPTAVRILRNESSSIDLLLPEVDLLNIILCRTNNRAKLSPKSEFEKNVVHELTLTCSRSYLVNDPRTPLIFFKLNLNVNEVYILMQLNYFKDVQFICHLIKILINYIVY